MPSEVCSEKLGALLPTFSVDVVLLLLLFDDDVELLLVVLFVGDLLVLDLVDKDFDGVGFFVDWLVVLLLVDLEAVGFFVELVFDDDLVEDDFELVGFLLEVGLLVFDVLVEDDFRLVGCLVDFEVLLELADLAAVDFLAVDFDEEDLPAVVLPVAFEGWVVFLVLPVLASVAFDLMPATLLPVVLVDLAVDLEVDDFEVVFAVDFDDFFCGVLVAIAGDPFTDEYGKTKAYATRDQAAGTDCGAAARKVNRTCGCGALGLRLSHSRRMVSA